MEFTATGLASEGLLRQLMPSALGALGFIIFVLIAAAVLRSFMYQTKKTEGMNDIEINDALSWISWARGVLVGIAFVSFVWSVFSVTTVNRMPRSDVDGSAVYEQMQDNIND